MLERRKHHRGRDFACGTIVDGRRNATYDCVLRNLSDGGALLLVDEPSRAPVELELAVRGGMRAARIVWRSETEVGIAFAAAGGAAAGGAAVRPAPASVVSLDAARRARVSGSDERRLADRIARFVRSPRRPDRG